MTDISVEWKPVNFLEERLKPHRFKVEWFDSEPGHPDGYWVVRHAAHPGAIGTGDNIDDALEDFADVCDAYADLDVELSKK